MSLAVAFRGPEGIVLAADSRVTMQIPQAPQMPPGAPPGTPLVIPVIPSYFDNTHKLLAIKCQPFVGIVTFGAGAIGQAEPRTAHSFLPEFEAHLAGVADVDADGQQNRLTTEAVATEVGVFFTNQWSASGMPPAPLPQGMQAMTFLIGGFDEGEAYGHVYEVEVPNNIVPVEKLPFAPTIGGQNELMTRLLVGFDPRILQATKDHLGLDDTQVEELKQVWGMAGATLPIPYQILPLQDCVDLSAAMISMTTLVQSWMFGIRGVGGEIDVRDDYPRRRPQTHQAKDHPNL